MKRFFILFFVLTFLGALPVWAEEPQEGSLDLLAELSIMNGDPDGNLRLDDPVTRAEFTKMAVASSSYRNSVAKSLSISPFPDVTYRHWAAPYVRVGVTNGLVSGYPDATFRPDEGVLFEEGVTIMLRVLGYTDSDFGVSWPYGQLGLAQNLDMTDDVSCSAGEVMNRGQVAQLIYNCLGINMKGMPSTQLVNDFDVQILEDVTLIADSNDDASIANDEVFTSSGTYKVDSTLDRSMLGLSGDVAIKNGTKLLAFLPESGKNATEEYVVYSTLSDTVMAYQNNTLQSVRIDDSTTVYKGKTQMNFGTLKPTLSLGDVLRMKRSGNTIDYITWQKGTVKGPLTVQSANWGSSWGVTENTTVMRDGLVSSASALQSYDIAYYLSDIDMVLAYSDKVSGIYEKATPNKDMPSSVTVSGMVYTIEGSSAFQKLSSNGEFLLGDTVTLLLGKDGGVADVVSSASSSGGTVVGYVTGSGRKDYQSGVTDTYSGYYVTIVLPSGEVRDYTTNKDYSSALNNVVKITFKDGNAVISSSKKSLNRNLTGTFSWDERTLGSYTVASDVEILDVGTTHANEASAYARVFPQRLDGVKISAENVLYYELNNKGTISKMILDNVTNDSFLFGLTTLATSDKQTLTGSYKYLVDGQTYSLSTVKRILNIATGQGIMIAGNPANPNTVTALSEITGKLSNLSSTHLTTGGESYPISGNVAVYRKRSIYASDYTKIPLSDIIGQQGLKYSAYYDKPSAGGGQIRIIVVYE